MEYFLLHAFHAKKFIVPDKYSSHAKEIKVTKRKLNNGVDELDADDANIENDPLNNDHTKTKKGPSYLGGLVLEPKKGLYDKYILLLDFNSLYPSIIQVCYIFLFILPSILLAKLLRLSFICNVYLYLCQQEYNICFTTVERSIDESIPRLPSSRKTGVLPEVKHFIMHIFSTYYLEYIRFMKY